MGNTIDIGSYRITVDQQIAEGGFSFVYSAHDQKGDKYALKKMLCHTHEQLDDAKREIGVLRAVRHPSILPLLADTSMPSTKVRGATDVFLLFPFCNGGSVFGAIFNNPDSPHPFPESECLRIFLAMCHATNELHQRGYAHRDIKPHNILLNGPARTPLMIDLGSCSQLRREITSRKEALALQEEAAVHCSAGYRAPELHDVKSSCVVDGRVDVWSLGCTLFAMAFGNCPFETAADGVMTISIMSGNYRIPTDRRHRGQQYSEPFCALFKDMLNPQPNLRITLPDLISRVEALVHGKPTTTTPAAAVATTTSGSEDDFADFRSASGVSTTSSGSSTSSDTKSVAIDVTSSTVTTSTPDVRLVSALQAGLKFTKLGRKGSPHVSVIRLETKEGVQHICWSHSNDKPSGSFPISAITRIVSGQRTPVFARVASQTKYTAPAQLSLSMSVMYRDPTAAAPPSSASASAAASSDDAALRSLDLIAADKIVYDAMWMALHELVPPKKHH